MLTACTQCKCNYKFFFRFSTNIVPLLRVHLYLLLELMIKLNVNKLCALFVEFVRIVTRKVTLQIIQIALSLRIIK